MFSKFNRVEAPLFSLAELWCYRRFVFKQAEVDIHEKRRVLLSLRRHMFRYVPRSLFDDYIFSEVLPTLTTPLKTMNVYSIEEAVNTIVIFCYVYHLHA